MLENKNGSNSREAAAVVQSGAADVIDVETGPRIALFELFTRDVSVFSLSFSHSGDAPTMRCGCFPPAAAAAAAGETVAQEVPTAAADIGARQGHTARNMPVGAL